MGHNAVLEWISTLLNSALIDGRLCGSDTGGDPVALQISLQKVCAFIVRYIFIELTPRSVNK